MKSTDRPETTVDDGVEAKPACVALVPLIPSAQWSHRPGRGWASNATFVTQLIATAEQAPQTRGLRRATLADARSAYHARQNLPPGTVSRTRQIV